MGNYRQGYRDGWEDATITQRVEPVPSLAVDAYVVVWFDKKIGTWRSQRRNMTTSAACQVMDGLRDAAQDLEDGT